VIGGLTAAVFAGRGLRAAADRGVHRGRRQAVLVRVLPDYQGQARADPAVAPVGRRLRPGRFHAAGPPQDRLRRRCATSAESRYEKLSVQYPANSPRYLRTSKNLSHHR